MQRREFLKGAAAAVASSRLPIPAFADRKRLVSWAPYSPRGEETAGRA